MSKLRLSFLLCLALLLTACGAGDGFADLDEFIKTADAKPKGKIDPLPEVQVYKAFTYSAANRRSPFQAPAKVVLNEVKVQEDQSNVRPDLDRPREVLESYALAQLKMVGTLTRGDKNVLWALISDGVGGIHMAKQGQYMGKNHGRIVSVNEARLDLIEIVPNGVGGWLERPRTVSLQEDD